MGNVKVDIRDLKKLQAKLSKMEKDQKNKKNFMEECAVELAKQLIELVSSRTPVESGELKKGWTEHLSKGFEVKRVENTYIVELVNPREYASFVEFGHKQTPGRYVPAIGKQLVKDFVKGQYCLTISEQELEREAPAIIEKKMDAFLKQIFE